MISVFKSEIDKARGEISRLNETRERLAVTHADAESAVVKLRAQLPSIELAQLLDDGPPAEPHHHQIAELLVSIDRTDITLTAIQPRLRKAYEALRDAQARDITRQADELGEKHAALVKKFDAAMRKVEEIAEAEFIPLSTHMMALVSSVPAGSTGGLFAGRLGARVPKTEVLAKQEFELRNQALQMANRPIVESGKAHGETLDILLAELEQQREAQELMIAPTQAEVTVFFRARIAAAEAAWKNAYEAALAAASEGRWTGDCNFELELAWNGGRIDSALSRVASEPVQSRPQTMADPVYAMTGRR